MRNKEQIYALIEYCGVFNCTIENLFKLYNDNYLGIKDYKNHFIKYNSLILNDEKPRKIPGWLHDLYVQK